MENTAIFNMDDFLKKYTRFLSKDIYISYNTYQYFFQNYTYFFKYLDDISLMYEKNLNIKRINNIRKNQKEILKYHNIKYLKNKYAKENENIEKIYPNTLNIHQKNIILSEEERIFYLNKTNNSIPLIVCKLKYLLKKIKKEKILILTNTIEEETNLTKELEKNNLEKIEHHHLEKYLQSKLNAQEKKITEKEKYNFFKDYLLKVLFSNKKEFISFYEAFHQYLYLNKDYQDFDTFHDYHSYLYKRKYLNSRLSLKKFLEKEILIRKENFTTILGEQMENKELVDIANFLFLNHIEYQNKNNIFLLKTAIPLTITYQKNTNQSENLPPKENNHIFLDKNHLKGKKLLESLTYELIKRRISFEKREEEEIYLKLKETSVDIYVKEFIKEIILPLTEDESLLKISKLTKEQVIYLNKILKEYQKFLSTSCLVSNKTLKERALQSINTKYYIVLLNINHITPKNKYFIISNHYPLNPLLQNSLKLFYDYKKYLQKNKWLTFENAYISSSELKALTTSFLRENISSLNENFLKNEKAIKVFFYDDTSKLLVRENLASTLNQILSEEKTRNILIGLKEGERIDVLLTNKIFSLIDKNTIASSSKKYLTMDLVAVKKSYPIIVLPTFIASDYLENPYIKENLFTKKILLATASLKAREKIYLMCPERKREEIENILKNFKESITYIQSQ